MPSFTSTVASAHPCWRLVLVFTVAVITWPATASESYRSMRFSELPLAAKSSISSALGRDASRYYAMSIGSTLELNCRGLTARFTSSGAELQTRDLRWGMSVERYGYGSALRPVSSVVPQRNSNRVEYRHGIFTEWYANGPAGLEQGFTVARRPKNASSGPLTIAIATAGSWTGAINEKGDHLVLRSAHGGQLDYSGLSATDAGGKELRAWLELHGKKLLLRVAEDGARYPLTIDPWVQVAELTSSDGGEGDSFAASVAIDGSTIVVGAPLANQGSSTHQGAAYVFIEPSSGWANATQTAKLTASDGAANDLFGYAVAVSGTNIIVGAPYEEKDGDYNVGAAYVFVEPQGGWADATETAELKRPHASHGLGNFGVSVAIDGQTAIVGWNGLYYAGHVYVFVEPPDGWETTSRFTADLTSTDEPTSLGTSTAISGSTIVAGADIQSLNGNGHGAAFVYVEPPGGWASMTQTARLTTSIQYIQDTHFGAAVAIRDSTVIVGAPTADPRTNIGAAYVFVRPGTGWTDMTETAELKAADGQLGDELGSSVGINGGGNTVWVGAPGRQSRSGVVYVFVKPTNGWTTTDRFNAELSPVGGAAEQNFGSSLAISGDTELIGGPTTTVDGAQYEGAAYVFGPSSQQR
jgi:hypothetical protein